MIRLIDFLLSLLGILFLSPIMVVLLILGFFDTGSPLFFQLRMGKNKKLFKLVKYRSMRKETQSVSTHLVDIAMLTMYGMFIRKTKLDELPQLFNVLLGDMSLVGPRPNLPNQIELIAFRDKYEVYSVRPGITGLSQINEIDMSTPEKLAKIDHEMIARFGVKTYIFILFFTITGKGFGDRVINN
jgi:lipopolysaccharide/colanic/teichoic acid biosynthesis glycosyltransferase